MLGFGGHFLTKARRYSVRFRDLREARITYRRGQDPGPEHGPIRTADHTDDETILIVGTFSFAGTGWKTSGDALLANTAADQARKRRQAGRDELADEYDRQHDQPPGRINESQILTLKRQNRPSSLRERKRCDQQHRGTTGIARSGTPRAGGS